MISNSRIIALYGALMLGLGLILINNDHSEYGDIKQYIAILIACVNLIDICLKFLYNKKK